MHIAAVLKRKGSHVVSIAPDRTIAEAASLLTENGIGAVLVLSRLGPTHDIARGQGYAPALLIC